MDENKKIDNNLVGMIPQLKPSKNFSTDIMNQIQTSTVVKKVEKYQPVIAIPFQYAMISVLIVLIISSLFYGNTAGNNVYVEGLSNSVSSIELLKSPVVAISTFSILLLLLVEKGMNRFIQA